MKFLLIIFLLFNLFSCDLKNEITITIVKPHGGSVVYQDEKISNYINIKIKPDTSITLSAISDENYNFLYWEGIPYDKNSPDLIRRPELTFSCKKSIIITAKFAPRISEKYKLQI